MICRGQCGRNEEEDKKLREGGEKKGKEEEDDRVGDQAKELKELRVGAESSRNRTDEKKGSKGEKIHQLKRRKGGGKIQELDKYLVDKAGMGWRREQGGMRKRWRNKSRLDRNRSDPGSGISRGPSPASPASARESNS